jgi:hypothetical protein
MPPSVAENGTVMRDPVERLAALPMETAVPGGVNPPCEISAVFKGAEFEMHVVVREHGRAGRPFDDDANPAVHAVTMSSVTLLCIWLSSSTCMPEADQCASESDVMLHSAQKRGPYPDLRRAPWAR